MNVRDVYELCGISFAALADFSLRHLRLRCFAFIQDMCCQRIL